MSEAPSPATSAQGSLASSSTEAGAKPKRSTVACRRCRRLRTRCLQAADGQQVPCLPCRQAGPDVAKTCAFAGRGDNADRHFRIKRVAHEGEVTPRAGITEPSVSMSVPRLPLDADVWTQLPPHEELVQGCRVFLTTCLQVGFVPKALFLEQLESRRPSVNVFLLVSILGISARFTPSLCARFRGSGQQAADFFWDVAHGLVADEMWHTSLATTQAFFLLGMAAWGRGDRGRSAIHMGIAVRMAGVLRLHREETYARTTGSTEATAAAEAARRTFWVIQNRDNLYAQEHLPLSFAKSDITTLLPADESDFAFGRNPPQRAALAGTVPALRDPSLASLPSRSLFATLIQAHDLWGGLVRHRRDVAAAPWHAASRYSQAAQALQAWEAGIPRAHTWSPWNLRGFKAEHTDLAYLSVVTVARLNNIALRRTYLDRIVKAVVVGPDAVDDGPPAFWSQMSRELFDNAWALYEAVDVWFSLRAVDDGFPAMLAFCTYVCGSLACHLRRWPALCPGYADSPTAPSAARVLARCIEVLTTFADKWPTASPWARILRQAADQAVPDRGHVPPVDDIRSQEAMLTAGAAPTSPSRTASPSTTAHASPDLPENHLHLLSRAAIYNEAAFVDTSLPLAGPPGYPPPPPPPDLYGPSPSALDMLALPDPLDLDLGDVIQGYVHFGCGWQP